MEFAVALLDPSRADMALHRHADMVRAIVGARQVEFLPGLAGSQSQDALAELGALSLRPADLLVAAFGGRPSRPRVAVGAFASAAAADVDLLPGGLLPTRISTRSAVSRSVN